MRIIKIVRTEPEKEEATTQNLGNGSGPAPGLVIQAPIAAAGMSLEDALRRMAVPDKSGPGFKHLERIRKDMLFLSKVPRELLNEFPAELDDIAERLAAVVSGIEDLMEE